MKLEDQVCTLAQAKRLKELGVSQNSYFIWDGFAENISIHHRITHEFTNALASAFTVAELGVMLPAEHIPLKTTNGKHFVLFEEFNTEAEARADILIYLLENKLITAEEVNQRLTNVKAIPHKEVG